MLNENNLVINLQKFNIKNLMNFLTSFFNTNNFLVLLFILYYTSIIDNNDIYKIIIVNIIGLSLKILLKRNRPYISNLNIENLSNSKHCTHIISKYSLPSGHTIQATMLGLILINKYNNDIFLLLPAIIGFSRIYLGVHYLTDVLLAFVLSFIVYYYF